jgi:hypothetical protein
LVEYCRGQGRYHRWREYVRQHLEFLTDRRHVARDIGLIERGGGLGAQGEFDVLGLLGKIVDA